MTDQQQTAAAVVFQRNSDVTEFPLWAGCPVADKLPSWCEVRRGNVQEQDEVIDIVVFIAKLEDDHLIHCAVSLKKDEVFTWNNHARPMLNNLGGTIFARDLENIRNLLLVYQ